MKTFQLGVDKSENYEIYFCIYDEGGADIDVLDKQETHVLSFYVTKKDMIKLRDILNKRIKGV